MGWPFGELTRKIARRTLAILSGKKSVREADRQCASSPRRQGGGIVVPSLRTLFIAMIVGLCGGSLLAQPCPSEPDYPLGDWSEGSGGFLGGIEFLTPTSGVTFSGAATFTFLTPLVPGDPYIIEYVSTAVFEEMGVLSEHGCSMQWSFAGDDSVFTRGWHGNGAAPTDWIRGDVNNDGVVNVADVVNLLNNIYPVGPIFRYWYCPATADANDDDTINLSDAIMLLSALYMGEPLPAPWPTCGPDPTPGGSAMLDCPSYWECP